MLEFVLVSGPRLLYRWVRDGEIWKQVKGVKRGSGRRALFVGLTQDVDLVTRFVRLRDVKNTRISGIVSVDDLAIPGHAVSGIPVLGNVRDLATILDELSEQGSTTQLLIMGPNVEHEIVGFADLVRKARKRDIEVVQFRGLGKLADRPRLVLSEVDMETLLRRPAVSIEREELLPICRGQRIMVTGGAGSIGSQLALRALELGAAKVLVVDRSEAAVFALTRKIPEDKAECFEARVVDICRPELLRPIMREFRADVIFHAAALKHVPLVELDWASAVDVNVMGTLHVAELASEFGASQFVLISSDKAAEPESVLGLTKRKAEQIVNTLHTRETASDRRTRFHAVRFGNVFASNGSVATIFREQIEAGVPLTVTDRDMTRYFMIMDEAVDLVLLAAASASKNAMKTSGIYMLDMGEPIRIVEMAENMIRLAGKTPYEDIDIVFTGIRPGEKMHEVLIAEGEAAVDIGIKGVYALNSGVMSYEQLKSTLAMLEHAVKKEDRAMAVSALRKSWRSVPYQNNVIDLYSSSSSE
jgi:O-antigen biosynthesis protein WbqV